jgi:Trk-type K+ transport system membrane component
VAVNEVAEELDEAAVALGAQLGAAAGLVMLMVVIHSIGLLLISKGFALSKEDLRDKNFNLRSVPLLASLGLLIFLLHIVEIFVFAVFYLAVGAMQTFEEALFYSASAYATLGRTVDHFPTEWRLIGAFEALIGFILIGWSTAFMVKTMNRLRD